VKTWFQAFTFNKRNVCRYTKDSLRARCDRSIEALEATVANLRVERDAQMQRAAAEAGGLCSC
jgi:hypothetical protein